ncbi:MAG: ABC transporter substrate-binding protein, partial [Syntrophomonadaceae bacterium]|nr:ABC transporter substrate-binding protein [Syntrophomonadaceae bacterium]
MKTKMISLLLALVMVLSLTACGGAGNGTTAPPDSGQSAQPVDALSDTHIFIDDCGREVEIPSEITRLVPSGPLAQIVLFALAPEMFVGLATKWHESAEGIIADEYLELPYFGQLYGSADLNMEELAFAAPQIIVDIGEAKGSIVADLDTLQTQTNIPSVFVSATLETMPETYRKLGELLGKQEEAERIAQFCERVYDRTLSIMEEVGDNKVDALYILGAEGLNVLANGSYHAELIDMLTNNLAVVDDASSRGTGNAVGMEQLSVWDPDYIIFAPVSIYSDVAEKETWREMTAIANGNYIEVPEGPHNWMGSPPAVQR